MGWNLFSIETITVLFNITGNVRTNILLRPVRLTTVPVESIIARAERDGTRVETRFRLSPKRTSPFKSVGASVQSTAGSRGVRISLSNAG